MSVFRLGLVGIILIAEIWYLVPGLGFGILLGAIYALFGLVGEIMDYNIRSVGWGVKLRL